MTYLAERDVQDIFHCRTQLEVLAARWAVERGSDVELLSLSEFLEESERAHSQGDLLKMTEANSQFHSGLYRCAHSDWLAATIEPLRSQTLRMRILIADKVVQPNYPEGHRQLYSALIARDTEGAERIARDHVAEDLKVVMRHLSALRPKSTIGWGPLGGRARSAQSRQFGAQ